MSSIQNPAVGPPLGLPVFDGVEAVYCTKSVKLCRQDLLFIFTDGVFEAADERDEYFGEDRLLACLRGASDDPAAEVLKKVMEEIRKFVGHTRQHDDITCLVFRLEHAMPGTPSDATFHATAIPS